MTRWLTFKLTHHRMLSVCWRWGKVLLYCIVVDALCSRPGASALELTGVLLVPVTLEGHPVGPVWHTASAEGGRPLGLTIAAPIAVRQAPLLNGVNGEIDVPLLNVTDFVGFWQYLENEFPPAMVMNLYFNGDNLTPGISVIMSPSGGLSQYLINRSPHNISLYLRDVESRPGLFFDDGTARATLGAAFYFPSVGPTSQWRPSQLENLDRVGVDDFGRDGLADGVLLFELVVGGSSQPTPRPGPNARPGIQAGLAVLPPTPRVGEDLWVAPSPGELLPTAPTAVETSPPEACPSERASTPSATADRTPTTSTTAAVTDETRGPSTPTLAPAGPLTTTPPTPGPQATSTTLEGPAAVTPPVPGAR